MEAMLTLQERIRLMIMIELDQMRLTGFSLMQEVTILLLFGITQQ